MMGSRLGAMSRKPHVRFQRAAQKACAKYCCGVVARNETVDRDEGNHIRLKSKSPWHYHPYSGPAYVIQGELTVDFDTESPLDDLSSDKISTTQSVYKAGESFLAVSNTWHVSSNQGLEDLVFMASWLGEKGEPIKVLNNKQ